MNEAQVEPAEAGAAASQTSPPERTPNTLAELKARFARAQQAIVGARLLDLSSERLAAMEARIADRMTAAVASMEALEGELREALAHDDWTRVVRLRQRTIDESREFEELEELSRTVADARMERLLREAMIARLGSPQRLALYDAVMMLLIFIVLGALLTQEFVAVSPETYAILHQIDFFGCCVFLADFFWRMKLAHAKPWFWRRYWLDFVTSIPLPAMQSLRVGRTIRLIRLIRLLRVARVFRILLFFWRGMDKLAAAFDVRLMRRSLFGLTLVLFLGAVGIMYAEGHTGADNVSDLGQSLWWSFTTVVTGGFPDIHNPESAGGRLLTIGLVIAGMVVVGIFTATLTSLLVRENDESEAILSLEERVLAELADLRAELQRRLPG